MYPAELSELAAILATATTLHRRGNLSGTLMSDQNLANEKGGAGRQRDDALSWAVLQTGTCWGLHTRLIKQISVYTNYLGGNLFICAVTPFRWAWMWNDCRNSNQVVTARLKCRKKKLFIICLKVSILDQQMTPSNLLLKFTLLTLTLCILDKHKKIRQALHKLLLQNIVQKIKRYAFVLTHIYISDNGNICFLLLKRKQTK